MGGDDIYDVFVSYARNDEAGATELNRWLSDQGLRTFFDRSALRLGLRWIPALEDAIERSRAIIILVGKHGIGSTQHYERDLALSRQSHDPNLAVIPVLMPGCDSPPSGFLRLVTWVDFSKGATVVQQTDNLSALRAAIRGELIAPSGIRASICPYRGLEPFREEDAPFFCGRDETVRELVAQVQAHSFVVVVGSSGSGKSSLVFAGLVPSLRQQRQSTMWDIVSLRPGASPLRALAAAFGKVPEDAGPAEIHNYLEREAQEYRSGEPNMLVGMIDSRLDAAFEKPDRALIYVDQWEELYSMAPAEDNARLKQHSADVERFVELLVAAASGSRSRANVVVTVRADFYNPLIRNPRLSALLPKQQVNIPPMSREDLRRAIDTPAKMTGLTFAPPRLIEQMLDDVGLDEGRLPLLQFALKETWEKRDRNKLTAEAYIELGGVAGAIEKTAEHAYERLTPSQRDAARRLFLRLVTSNEGQIDTRARTAIPDDPEQREIVNLFANPKTRLLVTGYETLQGPARAGSEAHSTVEVAHEALIQRWKTLRDWVGANRERMRARVAMLRAKTEWEEHGREERFLLDPGSQLERGRALLANPGDFAVDDIHDYVQLSINREQRRLDAERQAGEERERQWATKLAVQSQLSYSESPAWEPELSLGPLSAFAGKWIGNGFNTIFRPQNATTSLPNPVHSDNILELSMTSETLSFSGSLGSIPNRGTVEGDISLNGVAYVRSLNDTTNPGQPIGIDFETGIWVSVPETDFHRRHETVARMVATPYGTIAAQGIALTVPAPPDISRIDITPTREGVPIRFPSQQAANQRTARIPQDLTPFVPRGITQALLDDPNCMLRDHIAGQKILSTTVLIISTNPTVPSFTNFDITALLRSDMPPEKATFKNIMMAAVFWVETVEHVLHIPVFSVGQKPLILEPQGSELFKAPVTKFLVEPPAQITLPRVLTVTSTQIQYSQTVVRSFNGLLWPNVSVATLVPADPLHIPASAWD
jgi:energy-coupling factor transporter ATP-binding protein EcfA2